MKILHTVIKFAGYTLCRERSVGIIKSNWNVERYFGSKLEIPSPPKRPLSAYMIFCKENRREILKDNPSLSSPEQIKMLAKRWSLLTEEMKKPYEVSARQSTQLYGIEHKKFYESLTEGQKEELARLKAKKMESRRIHRQKKALHESGLPKAPNSAYALFIQSEARKKLAVKSGAEFIKKVAELWNNLPDESKKIYEKQAEEEKMRYAHEMKEWRTRMLLEGNKKILKAFEELKGKGKSMDMDEEPTEKKKSTAKKLTKVHSEASKN